MTGRKPPARRRKKFFVTTNTGQMRLAPDAIDATTSVRAISVAILFLIALAAVELTMGEAFYINNPAVIGNQRVTAGEIVAAGQIERLHVLWLQPEWVAASLVRKIPELREAFVWCALPAECTIQVTERQPAFEWRQGQTRMWVDADGVAFPARGQSPDMPVVEVAQSVTTLLPGRQAEGGLVRTMLALAKVLPQVRSYRFTPERGVEFSDPKGNWPVILGLGPEADVVARVTVWRALATSLASRNVHPKFVDVRYPNAPFYGR